MSKSLRTVVRTTMGSTAASVFSLMIAGATMA